MANKHRQALLFLLSSGLLSVSTTVNSQGTIGDLTHPQQDLFRLKAALERAKLQRELAVLSNELQGDTSEICAQKGVGSLTLYAIYGTPKRPFVTLAYNQTTQVDAGVGDILLCGEKVQHITLDKVVVEKAGKHYTIAGTVTAVPHATPKKFSSALFD